MRLTELRVPLVDAEVAADRLWAAGGRAVEELSAGDGDVVLRTVLAADPTTSRDRLGPLPAGWLLTFTDADPAPSEAWREHAQPMPVNDDLVITPAWCPAPSGPTVVEIEPAGSFGLGDHPTTRLSADAVWRSIHPGDRVLDVGCGSGVLSVIAALRGATEVVAIDVSDAAVEATRDNAVRNGVAGQVVAATTPLADVPGEFDVVLANILAPTLVALSADLRRVTALGGVLVISGILAESHDHVLAALRPMTPERTEVHTGWAAVELRHA